MSPLVARSTPISSIPAVPGHWQVRRNKTFMREVNLPSREGREEMLSVSHLTGVTPRSEKTVYMFEAESTAGYKLVQPGDLVINTMWAWMGAAGVATVEGIVSPAYGVYRIDQDLVDPRWIDLLIRTPAYITEMTRFSRGVTSSRLRLYPDEFLRLHAPVPPLEEQRAIADYLDTETTRIDALIDKKRRMIELLGERRVAQTTRLVSGGEDAHLTASPDNWFPSIPAGWSMSTVGRLTTGILDGPHVSPKYVEADGDGVPFISVRNISATGWDLDSAKYISRTDYQAFCRRVKPEVGDVLLTKGGSTGIAREVDLNFDFHVWVHVAILKVRRDMVLPGFLTAVLNSRPGFEQSQLGTRGATNQDLALGRIARIRVPVPPLEVQRDLLTLISQAESHSASAEAALRHQIDLLTEHRTALTTAAVTGELEISRAA